MRFFHVSCSLALVALAGMAATSMPAMAEPGQILPVPEKYEKLIPDEALMDARDPMANFRRLREPGLRAQGTVEGCPHSFDVLHYELDFDEVTVAPLAGTTRITFVPTEPALSSIDLDLKQPMTVSSVTESGSPLAFAQAGDVLSITLAAPASTSDTLTVAITYSGTPFRESFGGFHFSPLPETAFSMGVGLSTDPPSMGRAWFPCYDSPCDKATVALNIEVPLNRVAIANGALVGIDSTATTRTYHWQHDFPISTYLIAMSVANYKTVPDSVVTDPRITVYHHPGFKSRSIVSFQFVDLMMEAFETRFGPYPYEKFAFMTTNIGDMEHQTCVSHSLSLVDSTNNNDDILAHELMHQWFGDCVTYADWRDTWLSEGFATYGEAVFREYKNGFANYQSYASSQFLDRIILLGPLEGLYDPSNRWGTVAYRKGAALLHMLRGALDDDNLFWQVLRDYHANHAYANAQSADFINDVATTVGQDMSWFLDPWIYGSGHPVYEYGWSYDAIGGGQYQVDVVIRQVQSTGTLFDIPLDFRVQTGSGDFDFVQRIASAEESVSFVVTAEPSGLLIDPDDWVADEQQLAPTSVDFGPDIASRQSLQIAPARPNPFTLRSEIAYYLPRPTDVEVSIYDVSGRRVRTLVRETQERGSRSVTWDRRDDGGTRVGSGVYAVRLSTPEGVRSTKLTVLD